MKYNDLKSKLEQEYKDTKFYIKEEDDKITILYNNIEYINNDQFLDRVIDIASELIEEEMLWDLSITYDLDNESLGKELIVVKEETFNLKEEIEFGKNFNQINKILEMKDYLEEFNFSGIYDKDKRLSFVNIVKDTCNIIVEMVSNIGSKSNNESYIEYDKRELSF